MKTIIATLLLATLAASAQGLTRDITIGLTTLTVKEGRIVALVEPAPPTLPSPVLPTPVAPEVKQSLVRQKLAEHRARAVAPKPAPKIAPAAATTPVALGPVYDIDISNMSGVRITVVSTNTFTVSQLRQWLREASRTVR